MATLEKLRNRAGTLVAVVIGIALLAFILGDLFGSGGSLFSRNQFEIAVIGGKSIPYQSYQQRVDYLTELNKASRGQSALDEQTMENIREEVWNEMVQENVLGKRCKALGIAVSTDELFDMVQGRNIHPIIQQEFGNPQTGEVDTEMIIQFLRNMDYDPSGLQKQIWLYLESLISRDRLITKYNNLISKGLGVTSLHAEKSAEGNSKKVDFSFIVANYNSLDDSLYSISNSELKSYYSAHKEEYKQDASRDVEYVIFPITPSKDDFAAAEEWMNKISTEFITANNPAQFTNLNSDTPFDAKYYKKGEFLNQEINGWAFEAQVGNTLGPIFDEDSYLMAYLVDVAQMPDSVKARHILIIPQGNTYEDYQAAQVKADSIFGLAKQKVNFAQLAREHSEDRGSAPQGGDLGWFADGVMVKPFNDACFSGKKGDVVLVETQFGFHIIEIQDRGLLTKKVQVAILERNVTPSSRTYQIVYQKASEFAGINNTFEKFTNAAQEQRLTKRVASNLKELDRRISGLENPREMVRWAFTAKVNDVSNVFEFGENFVVATLKTVREKGYAPIAQVEDAIKAELIKEKKAETLAEDIRNVMQSESSIAGVAKALSLSVQSANRISFSSYSLPTAGYEPKVIASASNAQEGEMVGPVRGNSGVFLLSVNAINVDDSNVEVEKQRIYSQYLSRSYREAFEAIKKEAGVADKRSKFY